MEFRVGHPYLVFPLTFPYSIIIIPRLPSEEGPLKSSFFWWHVADLFFLFVTGIS